LRDVVVPDTRRQGIDVSWCAARPRRCLVRPEQGLRHADAPPAHFDEAQAEQALWQEFRDYGTSINNALTKELRVHGGPSFQIFQVRVSRRIQGPLSRSLSAHAFSNLAFLYALDRR
jgi:hypothetical protein